MTMQQQQKAPPWTPTAGYFYAGIADEAGDKACAKVMMDDADAYWDEWEERAQMLYDQLVPGWWGDRRQRLDHYWRKTQGQPDPAMNNLTPWQVQELFYPDDFAADQKDFLALREMEAAGKL